MKNLRTKAASTMILLSGAIALGADAQTEKIINELAECIEQNYVFPDLGGKASQMLKTNLENGKYDDQDREDLASHLSQDLRSLTHDLHFGVRALPEDWQAPSNDEDTQLLPPPRAPYGFIGVERLGGNIGYINLRGFNQLDTVGETVEAVMQLVQGSNAVIFDLRQNGGGHPGTVQLISSYLFDPSEPVHLNSLYSRPDDETTEYWTHDDINTALAMPDVPVYVLTSQRTFSAAEEFTYNLKNLDRATIVGQTTGGGAHPVDSFVFDDILMAIIPTARAINPITGTNWEGAGVSPDIEVDSGDALDTAIADALQVAYHNGDESVRWGLASINARLHPVTFTNEQLDEYAGDYTQRHIRVNGHGLEYRRDGVSSWTPLLGFEKDQFVLDGFEGFILEFTRDDSGSINGITGRYEQGHSDRSPRT